MIIMSVIQFNSNSDPTGWHLRCASVWMALAASSALLSIVCYYLYLRTESDGLQGLRQLLGILFLVLGAGSLVTGRVAYSGFEVTVRPQSKPFL